MRIAINLKAFDKKVLKNVSRWYLGMADYTEVIIGTHGFHFRALQF